MDNAMHPGFSDAQRKLGNIGRHVRIPLDKADKALFQEMWDEALEKHEDGRQCVNLVDWLIEQHKPLRW